MNLRPMTMDDADFMLELKNYPETRMFAIVSKEEIKREDHIKWLEKNILFFFVIESEMQQRVGAIRIFGNEISIWIDRKYWGLGVATSAIRMAFKDNGGRRMFAKIVNGNVASFRAFIKAGFQPRAYREENGIQYYDLQR